MVMIADPTSIYNLDGLEHDTFYHVRARWTLSHHYTLHYTSITIRRSSVPLPLLCHLLGHHYISNFINTAIRLLPLPILCHLNLSIARSRNKAGLSDASNIIYLHTTGAYIKRMIIIIITLYTFIVEIEIVITSSYCWLSLSPID